MNRSLHYNIRLFYFFYFDFIVSNGNFMLIVLGSVKQCASFTKFYEMQPSVF